MREHRNTLGSARRRKHALVAGLVAIAGLVASGLAATAPSAVAAPRAGAQPGCTTAYLSETHGKGMTVTGATLVTGGSYTPPGSTTALTGLPEFCAVTVVQNDTSGNPMNVAVWLPTDWNSNFEGVGGGGYSCGISYGAMVSAIESGYASASTDCGHSDSTGAFALNPNNSLNWPLIQDFFSVGIHDMTVDGKALTAAYYSNRTKYTFFNGCSTGGREGLMEAQKYPTDYNGILSGAPAINWSEFIPAEIWPELVMKENNDYLPTCKENAFTEAVVKACDYKDGVTDGIIADPDKCNWNPHKLVGTVTPCGTITATDAAVVEAIWQGPKTANGKKLWYGLEPGASFSGLAATTTTNGVTSPNPFFISAVWLGTWEQQSPSWDWTTLTYSSFVNLYRQSVQEFSRVAATNNPNLSKFEAAGGKIVIWHGLADQLIFPQGTINYYQRVQSRMGAANTASFARLFLAPGAQHCSSAAGPAPSDPFDAVVSWVNSGKAPKTLEADVVDPTTGITTKSSILCPYPAQAKWNGKGSTNDAKNFSCKK